MRVSELTYGRELRALRDCEALNGRAMHRSGFSLCPYPDQGEGSFSELVNFPEVPGVVGLSVYPMFMVAMELQELLTYIPHQNMEYQMMIWVHNRNCAISRLCNLLLVHNLEIGTQFPDSETARRNRLHETYTFITAKKLT